MICWLSGNLSLRSMSKKFQINFSSSIEFVSLFEQFPFLSTLEHIISKNIRLLNGVHEFAVVVCSISNCTLIIKKLIYLDMKSLV